MGSDLIPATHRGGGVAGGILVAVPIGDKPVGVKRVLWLHTQPEHYFICMMDALQARSDALHPPGSPPDPAHPRIEYIAAYSYRGPGWYVPETPPRVASLILNAREGKGDSPVSMGEFYNADWRKELLPLKFDAVVVAGYGLRTHREVILHYAKAGIPVAMYSDSNLRSQRGSRLRDWATRIVKRYLLKPYIRTCSKLLTANRLGVAYWRFYGAPSDKIILCPCYADYPGAALAAQRPRENVLARIGIPPTARYLFTAARLVSEKGIDLMIRAFKTIAQDPRFANLHYVVAGTGPDLEHLKRLAGPLFNQRIHLLGFQQPADNFALMAHADAFILPSRYEPHGIVVSEAMSVGTPVIASDIGGAAVDLIQENVNGCLFRTEDADDLTAKLRSLLEDPDRLAAMRAAVHDTFQKWFSSTNPVDIVEDTVGRMLSGEASSPHSGAKEPS